MVLFRDGPGARCREECPDLEGESMRPCISQATILNTPFGEDLEVISAAGWRSVELWLTKLEQFLGSHEIREVRTRLDDLGLKAEAASFQGGLLLSSGEERTAHWEHFRKRLEWLEALGVENLVIVPDFGREPSGDDLGRAMGSLGEAVELAGRHQVRLALELQKTAKFCASLDTAVAMVGQIGSENLGVCLDLFHYYMGPSKFEDLGYLSASNLAWVQISDVAGTPRELASDSDRVLPGDGDFLVGPILDALRVVGYEGGVSVEVLNPSLWAIAPDRVAQVALQALTRTLGAVAVTGEA